MFCYTIVLAMSASLPTHSTGLKPLPADQRSWVGDEVMKQLDDSDHGAFRDAGTYSGSVTLAWTAGSLTIPVTLTVTGNPATAPVMTAVVAPG
jgi:hypothetical protein